MLRGTPSQRGRQAVCDAIMERAATRKVGEEPRVSNPSQPPQPPSGQPGTTTTTVVRRRTERRGSGLGNTLGLVIDLVILAVVLVVLNWPALRDSLFAIGIQRGSAFSTQPLLARGFLGAVLPWLDGAIVFAVLVRTLSRFTATSFFTLLLGLLARLAGAAVIVYMLLQPVIFSTPSGAPAPFGGGGLQAFAEFWGRGILIAALVLAGISVLVQLWALVRHRRS